MREEEFKRICEELNGVFMKDRNGSIKCVFPVVSGERGEC
jgi:hypothetical protein